MKCNKHITKTLVIARFGMLECGQNFKGSISETCRTCQTVDDENHRLNHCTKLRSINYCDQVDKVDFANVFSNDLSTLKCIIEAIEQVWNTKTAHGTVRS